MRILHIEDEPWDSGIAHYTLTLAKEEKRRGHEVHFWGRLASEPCRQAALAGLNVREIDNPWLRLPQLRSELSKHKIEIVNAHTGSAQSLAAALVAWFKIPLVRTRGDARRPANHALARALARRTKAYIAANSYLQAQLRDAFNGSRVELIFQGLEDASGPAPLPEEPVVGILGRLDPVKGHEDFLVAAKEVLRALPQTKFLVAGSGSRERSEALKAFASRLGIKSSVEFLGYVPDSNSFLTRCRVGIVASLGSEAVSRATLEWMARGRPVITTKVGCLPDLVEHEKSGYLVPAGHPGQIALALKDLLKNPEKLRAMAQHSRLRFEERFSVKRFGDDTEKLYKDLLHDFSR